MKLLAALFLLLPVVLCAQQPEPPRPKPEATAQLAAPVLEKTERNACTFAPPAAGTHIRYSLDGSVPNAKSGPCLAPIAIPAGYRLRAVTVSDDRKTISPEFTVTNGAPKTDPSTLVPCTQDRDFPTYDWAKRHAAVTDIINQRKPALVFIGDSITQMFGGDPCDRSQPGAAVWDKYYGKRNPGNLGFGYDYVENTLWRLQHGELDGTTAKLVVLNIGTNNVGKNSAEEIVQGIKAVLAEIRRSQPKAAILLLGIYPRGPKPDATREKITTINQALAALDGKDQVTFADVTAKLLQPDGSITKETMGDYLHPTAKGYEIIAEALEPTIRKGLGE
jgi:lysophospholipase L1-like esterase